MVWLPKAIWLNLRKVDLHSATVLSTVFMRAGASLYGWQITQYILIENGTQFVCLFSAHRRMPFASSKCYHHFQRVLNRSNELTKNVLANKSFSLMLATAKNNNAMHDRTNTFRVSFFYSSNSILIHSSIDIYPCTVPTAYKWCKVIFSSKFEIHLRCGLTKYWNCGIILSVSHWKFNLISKHLCSFIDEGIMPSSTKKYHFNIISFCYLNTKSNLIMPICYHRYESEWNPGVKLCSIWMWLVGFYNSNEWNRQQKSIRITSHRPKIFFQILSVEKKRDVPVGFSPGINCYQIGISKWYSWIFPVNLFPVIYAM